MKKYLLAFIGILLSHTTYAIDVDAGDYDYAPNGTNLAILYYQHANRDSLYIGNNKSDVNVKLVSDVTIARFAHYMSLGNFQIAPQIFIPVGYLNASKDISSYGNNSGLGDIIIATTFFVYHNEETKTNIGITPYLFLPTGKYSQNEILNIGENRLKFTLQGGYTTQLIDKVRFDAVADFTVYGDNKDAIGGGTLQQDIGYQVQTSLRYQLNPQTDLRAGLSYSYAGDTEQNNIKTSSLTQTKFVIGAAYSPSARTQLIANYGRDLSVENGFKESNRINLRFLYAF
ncbi:MAG: transporter [Acinetobacter sp.]